jgi:hypothetical protein
MQVTTGTPHTFRNSKYKLRNYILLPWAECFCDNLNPIVAGYYPTPEGST